MKELTVISFEKEKRMRMLVLIVLSIATIFFQMCAYGAAVEHDPLKFLICTALVFAGVYKFTLWYRRK